MSALGTLTSTMPAIQWAILFFRPLHAFLLQDWGDRLESLDKVVKRTLVVEKAVGLIQGTSMLVSIKHNYNGRQCLELGCPMGKESGSGTVVPEGGYKVFLLEGTEGSGIGSEFLLARYPGLPCPDFVTTVAYLNKLGGTRSKALQLLATVILEWAESHLLSLSAVHLKGTLNKVADFRIVQTGNTESGLGPKSGGVCPDLPKRGEPQVELFASRENTKLPLFFSLHRHNGSLGVDALEHPWEFRLGYAFPQFQMVKKNARAETCSDSHSPILAKEGLVQYDSFLISQTVLTSSSQEGSSVSAQ